MSDTHKTKITEVSFEDGLAEISILSKNANGLIINHNAKKEIGDILSGENKDIENVAKNPENTKKVSNVNNKDLGQSSTKKNNIK